MYVCMYAYIYIYIYTSLSLYIYMHTYLHTFIMVAPRLRTTRCCASLPAWWTPWASWPTWRRGRGPQLPRDHAHRFTPPDHVPQLTAQQFNELRRIRRNRGILGFPFIILRSCYLSGTCTKLPCVHTRRCEAPSHNPDHHKTSGSSLAFGPWNSLDS